jgi:hypothetical protein
MTGKRSKRSVPPLAPADERRVEALTVAMALAPGVYARNRMFKFFAEVAVRRARARAATLRGIVPQLSRAQTLSVTNEGPIRTVSGEPTFVLRYRVPSVLLSRVVELSPTELAALRVLATRAGLHVLPASDEDRAAVERALSRLILPGEDAMDLALAARACSLPPSSPES